jgi:Flp pilus assembly secretin CpaC
MFRIKQAWIVILVLFALILAAGSALAEQEPADGGPGANVLLTVRLARLDAGKPTDVQSYNLVVVSGGLSSKLLSGARVPFPARAADDDDDDGMVTYVYQNIGFTTEAHAWVLEDGRIKLIATLENSFVEPSETKGDPPSVETRQLSVNAILTPGKPLEVTRIEGIRDSSGFVEIEAKVLD